MNMASPSEPSLKSLMSFLFMSIADLLDLMPAVLPAIYVDLRMIILFSSV